MEVSKFLQAKKIQSQIIELKNIRDKISKNNFYIGLNIEKSENESQKELREFFMPM